ncbi:MAG: restriction endonuclease, partial [Anaerolineae bacterium]|nr:restriction endonuclease [Anaerolineae bacterium]
MDRDTFLRIFQAEVQTYTQLSVTESGGWIVKGFVDVFRRLYAVPRDTKVVARVLETLLAPRLAEFAEQHGYDLRFPQQQNFYPDVAFVSRADPQEKHAVDIKSSYRTGGLHINGMALGAYTGYFRDRNSLKNALFSYNSFQSHLVLGIIYSRAEPSDEPQPFAYALDDL